MKMKKLLMTCLFAVLAVTVVSLPTKAATTLKKMANGTTYTSYDVTRDGKKDKIKAVRTKTYAKDWETEVKVYVNGKHRFTASAIKGADLYIFTSGSRSTIICGWTAGDGGKGYTAYEYKNGKFATKDIEPYNTFYSSIKVANGKLQIIGQPKFGGWFHSFSNFTDLPFKLVKSYKMSNGLLKETWAYASIASRKTIYAKSTFTTGKTYSSISKKDGVKVTKGSKVTITAYYHNSKTYADYFKISVNGKTGWFKDSSSIQFKR